MSESEKIRSKIKDILKEEGRLRTKELVERVCETVDISPKPVYRELKQLADPAVAEIKKIEHNKAFTEYESVDYQYNINSSIFMLRNALIQFDIKLKDWHNNFQDKQYLAQLFALFPLLKALEDISAQYSVLENLEYLTKSKEFKEMKKLIEKRWRRVILSLDIVKKEDKFSELLLNLRYSTFRNFGKYDNQRNPLVGFSPEELKQKYSPVKISKSAL